MSRKASTEELLAVGLAGASEGFLSAWQRGREQAAAQRLFDRQQAAQQGRHAEQLAFQRERAQVGDRRADEQVKAESARAAMQAALEAAKLESMDRHRQVTGRAAMTSASASSQRTRLEAQRVAQAREQAILDQANRIQTAASSMTDSERTPFLQAADQAMRSRFGIGLSDLPAAPAASGSQFNLRDRDRLAYQRGLYETVSRAASEAGLIGGDPEGARRAAEAYRSAIPMEDEEAALDAIEQALRAAAEGS